MSYFLVVLKENALVIWEKISTTILRKLGVFPTLEVSVCLITRSLAVTTRIVEKSLRISMGRLLLLVTDAFAKSATVTLEIENVSRDSEAHAIAITHATMMTTWVV